MKQPRPHTRRIDALADLTDVNRWASDVDLRLKEIIESLKESQDRLTRAVTTNRGSVLARHAAQHRPLGFDAIPTGPAITLSAMSTNTTGADNTLARPQHSHAIMTSAP